MSLTCVKALFINSNPKDQQFIGQLTNQFTQTEVALSHAKSADEAIERLNNSHIDIVLMGTEAELTNRLNLLNNLSRSEHFVPPVLILTHKQTQSSQENCLKSGAIDNIDFSELSPALLERSVSYAIRHKADELRLLKLAHHDPLTGLSNRLAFKNHLIKHMAQSKRSGDLLALLIIDLDNFKLVNDTLGHDIGDKVLISAAEHLQENVRETDLVARLGGDEFAIIATQLHSTRDAAILARNIIEHCYFKQPGTLIEIAISCSIGIALFPTDGVNHNSLMKHADNALLHAKKSGKQQFSFADYKLNLKDKFQHALDNDIKHPHFLKQLQLYYQPIIDVNNQHITGVEALLRWNHPSKGLLTPDQFLSSVDSNGLMNKVGNWVVHNACMQHLAWVTLGLPPIPVAVNLTAPQLENSYLINVIKKLIHHQQFNPDFLCLELSEADAFKCSDKVHNSLYKLHELGVHLTIDNFGKDYCSLTQLHRLPIDSIKIDRSLIQRAEFNSEYGDVTEAIIQLGKILNLNIIAQGIESHSCMDYITERDCHQAQGFYIAKPLSSQHFEYWLGEKNHTQASAMH